MSMTALSGLPPHLCCQRRHRQTSVRIHLHTPLMLCEFSRQDLAHATHPAGGMFSICDVKTSHLRRG